MVNLFKKRKGLAIVMVAIMAFTLLPVDLNWADGAAMIQELRTSEDSSENGTEESVTDAELDSQDASTESLSSTDISEKIKQETTEISTEMTIEKITSENSRIEEQKSSTEVETSETEILEEVTTELLQQDIIESVATEEDATIQETSEESDVKQTEYSKAVPVMEMDEIKVEKAAQSGSLNQYVDKVTIYDKDNQTTVVQAGMDDITLGGTDNFTIRYDFTIPNAAQNYQEGSVVDTYIPTEYCTFTNPDTLYDLTDSDGTIIARFSVDSTGHVVITFTEAVEGKSNVSGFFFVGCKLNAEDVEDQGEIAIDLNIASVPPIPITVDNSTPATEDASISKGVAGWPVSFGWSINLDPGDEDVTGMVIKDTLVGQVLDGDVTFGGVVMTEGVDYTFNESTGEFTFTVPKDISSTTSLIIPTTLKNENMPAEDSSQGITNTASLYGDDGTKKSDSNTATNWVTTDWINKSSSYDETNKTITWTIKVNNNNLDVENAVVEDPFLDNNSEFEIDALTINGVSQTVTDGLNPFPLSLGDIDSQQTITFTVKRTDGQIPTGTIENTATFVGEGVPSDAVDKEVFTKSVNYISKSGSYNQATGKVDWTILVNSDKATITNPVFTDTLPEGLTYDADSFTVNGASQTPTQSGQTLTYDFAGEKNAGGTISDTYTIKFTTTVGSVTNNQSVSFKNEASLSGDDVPADTTAEATVSFTPSLFKKVCNQWYGQNNSGGDYDGNAYDVSNHKIKWKLSVNESMIDMGDVTITDTLEASQTFLDEAGDVIVYKYVHGSPVDVTSQNVVSHLYNSATNQITFSFEESVTERYSIIYKTQIKDDYMPQSGEEKTYSNSATITYGSNTETNTATSPKVTGYSVDKTGYIVSNTNTDNGDGAVIGWKLDINKNLVMIPAGVITDTLQKGTALIEDSIVLREITPENNWGDGSIVDASTYSYTYNTTTRTFTFNMPENTNKAYRLYFNTKVVDTTITSVSNTAKFKGTSPTVSNQSTVNGIDTSLIGGGITIAEGTLIVIKVDENDQTKVLEGAVFEITDDNGNVYTSDPTDENGITTYDSLKLDTQYYLKEVVAPAGYELSSEVYEFEIATGTTDNTITYYYKDTKISENGSISVYKYDNSSPAQPLPGATFTLYNSTKTTIIDTQETKSNGVATFNNVPYGEYVLVETKAPAGYIMSDPAFEQNVTVDADHKTLTYDVYNTKEAGQITVYKKDDNAVAAERIPLPGAEFTLYKTNTEATPENGQPTMLVYKTLETDASGKIVFSDLPYGTYYLQETKAPAGYEITDSSLKTIVVNSNDTAKYVYTYTNKKIIASIKVKKTDKDTGTALAGAVFGLYDSTGNVLLDTKTSGTDGYVTFDELVAGIYIVKEISPPDKYNGTSAILSVNVTESTTYVYDSTFKNEEQKGAFSFKKVDSETKAGLEDAVFTLYDSMGNEVTTATSDENGLVEFSNLAFGTYKLIETTSPSGYYRNTQEINVTIDSNTAITIDDVENTLIPTAPPHIALKVQKIKSGTTTGIPGATIGLYKQEPGAEEVLITSVITDANGIAYFEKVYIGDDADETQYYVKEIAAPAGYLLNATQEVYVGKKYNTPNGAGDDISLYSYKDANDIVVTYATAKTVGTAIENTAILGKIILTKKDAESLGTLLQNAEFTFYTDKGCTTIATNIGMNGIVVTDANGVAEVSDVPYGTYYIKETKAPDGYVASSLVQKVEVKEDYATTGTTYSYTILNQKIKGKIQITKRDSATGAVLKGATFALCDDAGVEVVPNVRATTNQNGVATFNDLDITQKYYFKEITAPFGYKLSDTIYSVEISDFTENNSYVVYRSVTDDAIVGSALINKTDDSNPATPLSGAEFTLYKSDGTAVESKFTDATGQAEFTNISVGNYYIQETKAPAGYVLDNTKHPISSASFGDGTTPVTFTFNSVNKKMAAQIRIVKRDSVNATPLPGAVFSLHDSTGIELDRQTTGVDGVVIFNVSTYGDYTVKEVSAPTGYLIVENTYNFKVESNTTYSNIVVNEKIKGNIAIKKVNESGDVLDNAEFTLYKEDGTTMVTSVTNPVVTDINGEARFNNLDAGTYYVKETRSPDGYILKGILYKIVIDGSQGNKIDYPITIANEKNPQVKFANIRLTKTETGNANVLVPGAEYTLYKDGRPIQVQTTNESGVLEFKDVPFGTGYLIRETKAPEGYYLLGEDITLTVDETTVDASGLLMVNTSDAAIVGKVTLHKVDATDATIKLAGAVFQIMQGDTVVDTQTSNAEGVIVFENLKPGEYTIKEITAPAGYALSTVTSQITVTLDELEHEVTVQNQKLPEEPETPTEETAIIGKVILYKVDKDNQKKKLKGAVFELVSGDTVVATSKSDEDGLVVFDNVPQGEYTVREKKAPKGYKLSKKTIKVTITESKEYNLGKFTNKKKDTDDDDSVTSASKKTGDSAPLQGVIGLFLFAIAGLTICISYKKKLKE